MSRYRCPDNLRCPDDVVGCGAEFDGEPDHEGLVDCPHCGIWFSPAVEPRTKMPQPVQKKPITPFIVQPTVRDRLEYLRAQLRAERISYGELAELQGLAEHIAPGDVELLEAAGVPEFPPEVGGSDQDPSL